MSRVDLITVGNACVDLYVPAHQAPPRGGITLIPHLNAVVGGNGANTAITAQRCGVRTAIAGVLGDDLFGRHVRLTLAAEGVDTSLLGLLAGRASPVTLVQNDAGGERSFVHHPGTNADYALPLAALGTACSLFHFAAPELLGGFWPDDALAAAAALKGQGRMLSLDMFAAPGAAPGDEVARTHRPFLEHIDIVLPNEQEARLVTGRDQLRDMAAYFHDCGVAIVAIKRGEKGALVSWGGQVVEVPTEAVPVVDTCGAGDNFAAGFLAAHLGGLDPAECARIGCALGTLCVRFQGSTAGTADPIRVRECLETLGFVSPPPPAV